MSKLSCARNCRVLRSLLCLALYLVSSVAALADNPAPVTNWPSFFGNDRAWGYSPLGQINLGNVNQLAPAWAFSTGTRSLSSTPLVVNGIMYLIAPDQHLYALDAASGKLIWTYKRDLPAGQIANTGAAGLAAGFGLLFIGTLDNHLVAINAASGREVWDVQIEDHNLCKCGTSLAPLLVKDKVVVGVRGDYFHRAYLDAYNAESGKRAWRFWVTPGPGEPGNDTWPQDGWKLGGGSTWYVGSYDAELNLVFWGTGNPQPILNGASRPGANLYTESLVALNADTGELKWYYQEIPHDTLDFDSMPEPVLIDVDRDGKTLHLVVHPNKSGYTYVLDRVTGKFFNAWQHADKVNWNKGLDKDGKPIDPTALEFGKSKLICPSDFGSRATNHSAYSPKTGWWYGTSTEVCASVRAAPASPPHEGDLMLGGISELQRPADGEPHIAAFDPVTGEKKWSHSTNVPTASSLLATAGNLLFGGSVFGEAWALDAKTGREVWSFETGAGISSAPISYSVDGRQYIAIAAGSTGAMASLTPQLWPELKSKIPPGGSTLFVFALPKEKMPNRKNGAE